MLALLSRRSDHSELGRRARPWRFLAVVSTLAACALFGVVDHPRSGRTSTDWLRVGRSRGRHCRLLLSRLVPPQGKPEDPSRSSGILGDRPERRAASCCLDALLVVLPVLAFQSDYHWSPRSTSRWRRSSSPRLFDSCSAWWRLCFCTCSSWDHGSRKRMRELCGWLCRTLLYISAVWLLVALLWRIPLDAWSPRLGDRSRSLSRSLLSWSACSAA